jgi:hypothetical protein
MNSEIKKTMVTRRDKVQKRQIERLRQLWIAADLEEKEEKEEEEKEEEEEEKDSAYYEWYFMEKPSSKDIEEQPSKKTCRRSLLFKA